MDHLPRARNNYHHCRAQGEDMLFESLTFLIAEPIHEDSIRGMDCQCRDRHIHAMPNAEMRLRNLVMRPMDPANSAAMVPKSARPSTIIVTGAD